MTKNGSKYFNEVDLKVNFPEEEKKTLEHWYRDGIVNDYLKRNEESEKYFSFLDGPITANNPMGVHHAWGRTYKDLWQRFMNMRGYQERFQNGFDCQGLWVEVEVEKELGIKDKREIENLVPGDKKASVAKFVDLCKERVLKYSGIQTIQSKRLGYFMDWDNSYYTMSSDNNYMIWNYLKVCFEKGLIYKGHDVVPWCPRCQTAISQHEILTEDYKEVTHDSIYLKFAIKGRKNEYLLIWTTTPWTLPANTAVAVDAELDYALVKYDENNFWVAKDLVESVFKDKDKEIKKTVKGQELVGLKYASPFDHLPVNKKALEDYPETFHIVIATESQLMPISTEEGTGLVHTSTSTGEEDHKLGVKRGLPVIPTINDMAEYLEGFGFLQGKNAKKHPDLIIDFLRERETADESPLFAVVAYTHRYPACWRCKTELVWKITDEWYISMDKKVGIKDEEKTLREAMIGVAKKIHWIPEFGLERELDWLTNMHDWLISKKNRYWGLALPIWECPNCGSVEVIGSEDELKQKAVKGWQEFAGHTPHKPWIDEVEIKCPKCGKNVKRIDDVGNPWLDAGIVPFSTIKKDNTGVPLYWSNRELWEKWYPANFITESFPGQFKNWFYSMIAMSSVLEDREPYKIVLGYGTLLAEDGRPMHKSWGNSIEFNEGADKIGVDVMRWMFARQNPADNSLFGYRIADETRRMFHLKIWNIYNYFVTYANIDNWNPGRDYLLNPKSDNILDQWIVSRLKEIVKSVTTSLEMYNSQNASLTIEQFVDDVSNWYIRRSRERTGFAASSEEDKEAFYSTTFFVLTSLMQLLAPFIPYLSDNIYTNLTKEKSVHLSAWPELDNKYDQKLIKEMKDIRDIAEKVHALRKTNQIPVRQPLLKLEVTAPYEIHYPQLITVLSEELNVKSVIWNKGKEINLTLDTTITPELEEEAKTRELIRQIQQARKENGVNLTQRINVFSPWIPERSDLTDKIKKTTLTDDLQKGEFNIKVS